MLNRYIKREQGSCIKQSVTYIHGSIRKPLTCYKLASFDTIKSFKKDKRQTRRWWKLKKSDREREIQAPLEEEHVVISFVAHKEYKESYENWNAFSTTMKTMSKYRMSCRTWSIIG